MWSAVLRGSICNLVLGALVLMLAIILFPLRGKVFDELNPLVINTMVPIIRHRDPLRMRVQSPNIPTMLQLGPQAASVANDIDVVDFVHEHVLPDYDKASSDAAKLFFATLQTRRLTPLHASMMLMGCYGYVFDDTHHVPNTHTTLDVLQNTAAWTDYTTAFLLQALETKYGKATAHDRSGCSCMKDFANPATLILEHDDKITDKTLADKTQDTCTMQNTIDYALDGKDVALTGKNVEDLKKSVMFMPLPLNGLAKRQRSDPLLALLTTTKAGRTPTANIDVPDRTFIVEYCKVVPDCIDTWASTTASSTTVTNAAFFDELIRRFRTIMPHNKLRPPKLCATPEACAPNLAHAQGSELSHASYNAYVRKYREAFYTCSRSGVPQYTTLLLGRMKSHDAYNMGQNFLFLAALFAFTWSYLIVQYIEEQKKRRVSDLILRKSTMPSLRVEEAERQLTTIENDLTRYRWSASAGMFFMILSWIWTSISFGEGVQWFSTNRLTDDEKAQLHHQTDETSAFFSVFTGAVGVVSSVCFILTYYKFFEIRTKLSTLTKSSKEHPENAAVSGDLGFVQKSAPFSGIISKFPKHQVDTVDGAQFYGGYEERMKAFNNFITEKLQSMAPYAQVGQDLTVIVGLTALAVGIVAQRGVQDINVLSAVSVLFLAIGLIAHLSNMLRLMHVYLQYDQHGQYNDHVKRAAHHRVYLAVLLVAMLLVFVCLAGVDAATTTSSHTSWHQFLFALLALAILCGSDLLEQLLHQTHETDKDTDATTERFWVHVSTKNYYVAWLIVLALTILQLHRAMGICEATKGNPTIARCLFALEQ